MASFNFLLFVYFVLKFLIHLAGMVSLKQYKNVFKASVLAIICAVAALSASTAYANVTLTLLSATTVYEDGTEVTAGVRTSNSATHSVAIALTSMPTDDVVIELSSGLLTGWASGRLTNLSADATSSLIFTSNNWQQGQTVLFEALTDDDARDGVVSLVFSVSDASSASWGGAPVAVSQSYNVQIQDDDAATVGFVAITTTLIEDGEAGLGVVVRYLAIYGNGNTSDDLTAITELDLLDVAGNPIDYTPSVVDGACDVGGVASINDNDTDGSPSCEFHGAGTPARLVLGCGAVDRQYP